MAGLYSMDGSYNVTIVNGVAGSVPITVGGNVTSGSTDSGSPIKVGAVYNTSSPTLITGQRGDMQLDQQSALKIRLSGPGTTGADGLNNTLVYARGSSGADNLPVANAEYIFNGTSWDRQKKPNLSARLVTSAATNNATLVKNTPGDVFHIVGFNATAGVKYLKFYNKASTPAPASDAALIKAVFALPASAVFSFNFSSFGFYFDTGVGYAIVTGTSDTDNTAVASGDILGLNILYA